MVAWEVFSLPSGFHCVPPEGVPPLNLQGKLKLRVACSNQLLQALHINLQNLNIIYLQLSSFGLSEPIHL